MIIKKVSREVVFKNSFLTVFSDKVLFPSGRQGTHIIVDRRPFAGVVALLGKKLIIVKQHRYVVDKIAYEIPLGIVDKGESPRAAAVRELAEESGYKAQKIEKLVSYYPTYGWCTQSAHLFFTNSLKKTRTRHEDTEFLEIELWSVDKAFREIGRKIIDSASIVGLSTARERGLI